MKKFIILLSLAFLFVSCDEKAGTTLLPIISANTNISAKVFLSHDVSLISGNGTLLPFNTEVFDTDNIYDNVTYPERFTVNTSGLYFIEGDVLFEPDSTGTRNIMIVLNGTSQLAYNTVDASTSITGVTAVHCSALTNLNKDDHVELQITQNAGHALKVLMSDSTSFSMVRLGD